ncbi:MAG: hypothetical protein J0L96_16980 [Anaerolineae bacterium]|nr:hypothetical protein [Anaerolineae bacterium]
MKPHTYFRLALLTPFFLWGIALLAGLLLYQFKTPPDFIIILMTPILFYTIGIIMWFLPYMIVAIGLWIWSRNKSVATLRNAALTAPVVFYMILLLEALVVYVFSANLIESTQEVFEMSAILGIVSLLFGYLCVGIAFAVFKILQIKKVIVQEVEEVVPVL